MNAPHSEDPDSLDAPYPDPTRAEGDPAAERSSAPRAHTAVADVPEDASFADRAGRHAREAWDQIQMAFPRLMGQPGYWSPRRMFTPSERPFDPDDLPLEAERSEEERRVAEHVARATSATQQASAHSGRRSGWRSVTRLLRLGDG